MADQAVMMLEVEQSNRQTKEPYLGSVRFFKHVFLTIFALLIIVPSVISIMLGLHLSELKKVERELRQELENAEMMAEADAEALQEEIVYQETVEEEVLEREYIELPYTNLYPDFYAPSVQYSSINKSKVCYLTFDDGPSERTDDVLDVLEEQGVLGTFFVTKQDSRENRMRLQRTAEAGHTIGMHTASHEYSKVYASVEDFLADYYELYSWIIEVTGQAPTIYRFPGGSINGYNRLIYQEIIAEMTRRGFVYFDWNVSSGDSAPSTLPATKITENCLRDVNQLECAVILMHDSMTKTTTVDALTDVIIGYRENGFTIENLTPEVTPVIFGYSN